MLLTISKVFRVNKIILRNINLSYIIRESKNFQRRYIIRVERLKDYINKVINNSKK